MLNTKEESIVRMIRSMLNKINEQRKLMKRPLLRFITKPMYKLITDVGHGIGIKGVEIPLSHIFMIVNASYIDDCINKKENNKNRQVFNDIINKTLENTNSFPILKSDKCDSNDSTLSVVISNFELYIMLSKQLKPIEIEYLGLAFTNLEKKIQWYLVHPKWQQVFNELKASLKI